MRRGREGGKKEALQQREEPECERAVRPSPVFITKGVACDVTVGPAAARAGRSPARVWEAGEGGRGRGRPRGALGDGAGRPRGAGADLPADSLPPTARSSSAGGGPAARWRVGGGAAFCCVLAPGALKLLVAAGRGSLGAGAGFQARKAFLGQKAAGSAHCLERL